MSFLFASSHPPEVKRPDHDDAEEVVDEQEEEPMRRSGCVRALSHLPASRPRAAQQPQRGTRRDPAGLEKIQIDDANPRFVEHVRAAMRAEAGESPVAAALLGHVGALPGKISVKRRDAGLSCTTTDKDGNVTVSVNPKAMTGATMSHELGHVVQQAHAFHALQKIRGAGRSPTGAEIEAAVEAGRNALHQVVPVKDERDEGQEHKENEAMRISNIVNAERTASGMRGLPEAQKTPREFWSRQRKKQSDPQHQDNELPMPADSFYGKYDFNHVKRALGLDAHGQKPAQASPSPHAP